MCCKIIFSILAVLGIAAIIIGAVIGFVVLPDMLEEEIVNRVRLDDGTEQYNRWVQLPFPLTYKIYFFEITNPNEVLTTSTRPIVRERGPYVYEQRRIKRNIIRNSSTDRLSYYQDYQFMFNATASYPHTELDNITTLNAPLMTMFQTIELYDIHGVRLQIANNEYLTAFPNHANIFTTFTVREYLFDGINFCQNSMLQSCIFMSQFLDTSRALESGPGGSLFFSLLGYKNDNHDGNYEISAGNHSIEDLGLIRQWNGSSQLPVEIWGESGVCRNIRGTDSTIYPPFINRDDTLDIFSTDTCRVSTLEYVRDEDYEDIPGQRRELRRDTLSNTIENLCYCTNFTATVAGLRTCWPDGFLDLFSCVGSPFVMSNPHLLYSDHALRDTVLGLHVNETEHATFIVLEPATGTPLRGARRIQINMALRPINHIGITQSLPRSVMPLMWFEEGFELPPRFVSMVHDDYLHRLVIIDIITWVLIGVGIALFVGSSILMCVCCC